MRTMLVAAAAALSLSAGSAFAQGEGGPSDTFFLNHQAAGQMQARQAPAVVAGKLVQRMERRGAAKSSHADGRGPTSPRVPLPCASAYIASP